MTSRFEEIIGDVDAFRIMLDGAFRDWDGSYDVLLVDIGNYLFKGIGHPKFRPFCRILRSVKEGDRRCLKCDKMRAAKAAHSQNTTEEIYFCHAGLMDTALPIIIAHKHIATIFFGQVRSADEGEDRLHLERVEQLARDLHLDLADLQQASAEIPHVSKKEFQAIRRRVDYLVKYITQLGHERLTLQNAFRNDERRQEITKVLEKVAIDLGRLITDHTNKVEFWNGIDQVLEQVVTATDVSCAMLLVLEEAPTEHEIKKYNRVKAVAHLPPEKFKEKTFELYDPIFKKVTSDTPIAREPLDQTDDPATISGYIKCFAPNQASESDSAILAWVGLGTNEYGTLIFCLKTTQEPLDTQLYNELEGNMAHLAALIGTAYHNYRDKDVRRAWVEQVTHQLVNPLHAIGGHVENAKRRLDRWQEQYPQINQILSDAELYRWNTSFEDIYWAAQYAARLASNLRWVVFEHTSRDQFNFKMQRKMAGLLIKCARNFQAMAREYGLRTVTVDAQSVSETFDSQICVDEDIFRQAIENLIDNAIKYSYSGGDVVLSSKKLRNNTGIIKITNEGIRLREEEVERIFENGYRTAEAEQVFATGTGIGLYVARQIIHLHNGTLKAVPSIDIGGGRWRTTFVIQLPLNSNCK